MKVASLDLGSNTFLLLICEVKEGKIVQEFFDHVTVTRLGQGVGKTKLLAPDALERADSCLKHYAGVIAEHKPALVKAVATSAARDAKNSAEFLAIGKKYGIDIEIVSGEREAELTYLGATSEMEDHHGLAVVDVGGGSTEVLAVAENGNFFKKSLDVGSVRLTENFVTAHPISDREYLFLRDHCRAQAKVLGLEGVRFKKVLAVAGTPVTMAKVIKGMEDHSALEEGTALKVSDLDTWTKKLAKMSIPERQKVSGMEEKRADVIVAGSLCLLETLRALGVSEVFVSKKGVRYGLAIASAGVGTAGSSST